MNLNAYADQILFEKERDRIYRKYWLYFCQKSFLNKVGDTFSRDVCGEPVSVRMTSGGLIAFQNICAHRKASIFFDEVMNRPFSCKYHGWVYDDNAQLSKIPNSQDYNFSNSQVKKCGGLKRYKVCEVGEFVFVNLSESPIDIADQFHDELLSTLEDVTKYLDRSVIKTDWVADYNWKLNFENIMDWNHVRFVHPSSFNGALKPNISQTIDKPSEWQEREESFDKNKYKVDIKGLSYTGRVSMDWTEKWWRSCTDRYGDGDYISIWHMFPNLNFTSLGGDQFYIQQYDPISSGQTSVRVELMTSRRNKNVNFNPLLAAMIESDKLVIDEDIPIIQSQYRNLSRLSDGHDYFQGELEQRLLSFRGWLNDNIYI